MADDDFDQPPENWQDVGAQIANGALPNLSLDGITDILVNAGPKAVLAFLKLVVAILEPLAKLGGEALSETEGAVLPLFAVFVAPIVAHMFGTEVGAEAFESRDNVSMRSEASAALVDSFLGAIAGGRIGQV